MAETFRVTIQCILFDFHCSLPYFFLLLVFIFIFIFQLAASLNVRVIYGHIAKPKKENKNKLFQRRKAI